MKKSLMLFVVVLIVAALMTGVVSAQDKFKIGYSCNNFNDTFQTFIEDYARTYAEENNIEYSYADAGEDILKQQDQIKAFITEGVDAVVVVAVDTSAADPIIEMTKEAGIPVVFVNRNPFSEIEEKDIPENAYYVGSESIDAGIFQAEYLVKLMGEEKPVGYAILMGLLSNEAAVARTEGNKKVLDEYKNYKLLAEKNGDWQRDQGMTIAENWITAYGDELNAILSNNDEMALGAVEAVEAANRKDIVVMGVDLIADAITAIKEGRLAASVLQDAKGQGEGAMKIAESILKGDEVEKVTWIPYVLVTPENLADFE
ncbi:MAG: sugar ABC transporter substrate-binding protein [Chloroflexi bacterium]|jgi:inositol transport system substrate-binding protein|nr:sugar ABC transporter substrate-binding protein [Chloroflexota bacterium]